MSETKELIQVVRLPSLKERVQAAKLEVDQCILEASCLVCTEKTVKEVKENRSKNRKLAEYIRNQVREAKEKLLEPFAPIEEYCEAQLLAPLRELDERQKKEISEVEDGLIKSRCESNLRDYFSELCSVRHLEWLEYERAGVKVDMASARAKTPGKLRRQLAAFVQGIGESVDRISKMDYAEEIMVEFRQTLNEAASVYAVADRHRRIEEERAAQEARKAVLEQEAEAVHRVEVLAPPVSSAVPAKNPDDVFESFTYTVFNVKRSQLWKIRDLLESEGIKYE